VDFNVIILNYSTYLNVKKWTHFVEINFNNKLQFNHSVIIYLFSVNLDDDLFRSKHVVAQLHRRKLIMALLSVLFYCQVIVLVYAVPIYRD
jgi:hypothetical protein